MTRFLENTIVSKLALTLETVALLRGGLHLRQNVDSREACGKTHLLCAGHVGACISPSGAQRAASGCTLLRQGVALRVELAGLVTSAPLGCNWGRFCQRVWRTVSPLRASPSHTGVHISRT